MAISSWFSWVDKIFGKIRKELSDDRLFLISDGGTLIEETAAVLGVLDALNVLSFEMVGGANSQIHIHINQIQPLKNIANKPASYHNTLLKNVADRHKISVKMLTYLYENDFTSKQRWNLLEDYFLGKVPEEVERAVEKE